MLNKDNEIISSLMLREIQIVIDKYNNMDDYIKEKIKSILETIKDKDIESYLINNPIKVIEIAEETNVTEINEDIIILFVLLNLEVNEVSFKDTIAYYNEINKNNYIKIKRYRISKNNERTKESTKKEISERIRDKSYLEKTINKNNLADIWINSNK